MGGPGSNGIGDAWFRDHRGKKIFITFPGDDVARVSGVLKRWDHYNILIEWGGKMVLVKQAQGMMLSAEE